MSQSEIVIIGGDHKQAADYYYREELFGKAVILDSQQGIPALSTRSPGFRVVLVGSFHTRADATALLTALARRGAKVEDLTTEEKHV